MKIREIKKVPKDKIGRIIHNNIKSEPFEDNTASYLAQYGFTIEKIVPSSTPHSNNPDFLMNGSIWEAKAITTTNATTVKNRFRKASAQAGQSGKIIIDLRQIKKDAQGAEQLVIKMFSGNRRLRRMILINKQGAVFYFQK